MVPGTCTPEDWTYDYQADPPWIVARKTTCEASCATGVDCDDALAWITPPDDPLIDCTESCYACWGVDCGGSNWFLVDQGASVTCPANDPDPTVGIRYQTTGWIGDYMCSGEPPAQPAPLPDVCVTGIISANTYTTLYDDAGGTCNGTIVSGPNIICEGGGGNGCYCDAGYCFSQSTTGPIYFTCEECIAANPGASYGCM